MHVKSQHQQWQQQQQQRCGRAEVMRCRQLGSQNQVACVPGQLLVLHRCSCKQEWQVAAAVTVGQQCRLQASSSSSEHRSSTNSSSKAEQHTQLSKQREERLLKREQQQKELQQLQQHLQRCSSWRQLLPLAVNPPAAADAAWLATVAIRAAQLRPYPTPKPTDTDTSEHTALGAALGELAAAEDDRAAAAASAAAAAAAAAAGLSVDQHRHELLMHRNFVQHLLMLLAAQLSPAAAAQRSAPRSSSVPAALLCQLLSQLAAVRLPLPHGWPQQHLLPYLTAKRAKLLPEEVLAVLVGLAVLQPAGLQAPEALQQQLLCRIVGEQRQAAPVQQVACVLWAAARLRWLPGQQWVQQAAVVAVQQAKACSAGELAMALYSLARLRCDMLLLQSNLQQQQQQQVTGRGKSGIGVHVNDGSGISSGCGSKQVQLEACGSSKAGMYPVQGVTLRQQQQQWTGQGPLQRPVAAAPEQLLQAVFDHAAAFSPRELLGVLWATAELPLLPQQPVVHALLVYCLQPAVLQQYTGADLTRLLWFLARMQHQADLDRRQQQQLGKLPSKQQQQPQEPHRQWLHKQRQQRQQAVSDSRNDSSSSSNTLVTLQTVQPMLNALLLQLPVLPSHSLAAALRSIAALGLRPSSAWVGHVLQHCQLQLASMTPASLVLLATAVADLGYLPNSEWLGDLYAASQPIIEAFGTKDAGSTNADTSSSSSSSSTHSRVDVVALSVRQLEVLAGAVAKISRLRPQHFKGQKPPSGWLAALAEASAAVLAEAHAAGTLTPGQLSFWGRVMHRFGSLAGRPWAGPGREWWLQYLAYSQPLLQAATPLQLYNILEVLSQKRQQRQLGRLPEAWLQSFLQATWSLLPGAAAASSSWTASRSGSSSSSSSDVDGAEAATEGATRNLQLRLEYSPTTAVAGPAAVPGTAAVADWVLIGKALVQLGVLPSQEWRAAWLLAVEQLDASMTASWGNTFSWTVAMFRCMEAKQQQQQQHVQDADMSSGGTSVDEAAGVAAAVMPLGGSLSSGSDWAELADAFTAAAAATAEPQSSSQQEQQQQQQQLQQLLQNSSHLSATYDDSDSSDEDAEPELPPQEFTAAAVTAPDGASGLTEWEEQLGGTAEAEGPASGRASGSSDGSLPVLVVAGGELAQQLHDKFWRQLDSMDDMQQQLDVSLRRLQQPQQQRL